MEGDSCKKVTLTKPSRSCPTGYYEKNNQCFPGTQPSCPAGSTIRYGVCHAPDGSLSCPKGQYLDAGSNLCVTNRNDSQPTEWNSQDFNHFFEQGADLGGMLSSSVTMPSISGVGSINVNPSFLNAEVTTKDANLYNAISGGGVDANNGFAKPDGTYQNEDNQSEFVREQLKSNKSFLDEQENVPGATSEEQVDNTNHSALAYGALMDSRNLNPPRKVSRDSAMFQVSRETVGDAFNNRGAYFGDCSAETTTYQELDPSKIVTNQESCFKPNKNNLSGCIMERRPIPPTFAIIEGQDDARVQQCGEKCIQLTLGKTGDNYLPQYGKCGIYEKKIVIGLKEGFHVERATLTRTHYDDHFRLYADGQIIFNGVHANYPTPDGFPTSSMSCELSKSRDTYDPRDVTPQFEAALQNDDRIEFTYKVAVGGDGEAYGKVEIIFDKPISSLWGEELIELPKGCAQKLERPSETYCTASGWECTREFTSDDENFGLVNISKGDKGDGYGLPGSHGDVLILVARRDFEIKSGRSQNCGLVVATTWNSHDGNDDDGIYFCEDYAGVGTHTESGRQIRGTRLSTLMPRKGEWEIIAVRTDSWGSTWYRIDENGEFRKYNNQNFGRGPYDGLRMSGYRIARATSRNGLDWHNRATDPLYFAYWQMLSKPNDAQVKAALKEIYLEQPWLNYSALYPGDDGIPICMEAYAKDYVCDPLKGRKMSLNGGSFGFNDIINMDDACTPLDKNDECDAISQECVPGWEDPVTNTCYAWNVKYECQDTSNAVVTKTRKNDTCFTEDSCIDGTCDVRADETNTDFTNALTTYATMNELGDTKNCTTPNDPNSCRVFSGEPRWCGWDQLKVNDCCEQPSGVNVLDVFRLGQQMYTVTGYMASANGAFAGTSIQTGLQSAGAAVEGVWNSLTDPIADAATSAWNTVSSKLTGAIGNTAGNTSANLMSSTGSVLGNFKTSVMEAMSNFKDTLMQKIYDLLPEALQNAIQSAAQSLGASAGASGATAMNTVATSVMNVISFIGWAYAVYQLAKLAYTMLTACKKEEEDMGVQLLGKKCFKTHHEPCDKVFGICKNRAKNFYCCYESVLSRIIMEQATSQLGWNKKTFRDSMGCRGLKIDELSKVDFSKIDFSEWVNMMAQSDMLPTDKSMEDVTGGNISNGFGRSDALQRNKDRAPNNAWVERREEMEEGDVGNNVNCNQRPRPKSCDQGAF
ncbi:TPA: conjugal transfer protein TraN [Vibrio parahaemolyticus]|uniref:conjugal transfer protein TraN n=1 Tax=Vibrio campbellii TaxID=680 RepID=UPI001F07AAA4|nr:conjugal transfer protein TraN [Vibrio campbellii]UMM06763.1 conjugal transfer protein TraN [Vibrio campbellii]